MYKAIRLTEDNLPATYESLRLASGRQTAVKLENHIGSYLIHHPLASDGIDTVLMSDDFATFFRFKDSESGTELSDVEFVYWDQTRQPKHTN